MRGVRVELLGTHLIDEAEDRQGHPHGQDVEHASHLQTTPHQHQHHIRLTSIPIVSLITILMPSDLHEPEPSAARVCLIIFGLSTRVPQPLTRDLSSGIPITITVSQSA